MMEGSSLQSSSRAPQVITKRNLLLVEGEDEKRFWDAVLLEWGRNDVQTLAVGGRDNLQRRLPAVVKTPGFDDVSWLGICQDADRDPAAAFSRICGELTRVGLPSPARSWEGTASTPIVVAFVMPDGESTGDLEAMVWQAIANDPVAGCVDTFFGCIEAVGITLPTNKMFKARVHCYLSSRKEPDRQLGIAATESLLPLRSPVFERLIGMLPPFHAS